MKEQTGVKRDGKRGALRVELVTLLPNSGGYLPCLDYFASNAFIAPISNPL